MRRTQFCTIASAAVMVGAFQLSSIAFGAILFRDTFDRADSRNIDGSLIGIINNTGSLLPADGVYTQPWVDPANDPGPEDGNAANGGGARILSNSLQLAVGPGTSNAFVNHNFTNAEILAAGGFSVSLDVTGFSGTTEGQGGAFAIGMTQADAAASNDAFNGNPSNKKFTNAFPVEFTDTISDFWVGLRGDGNAELAWGHGPVPTTDPNFHVVNVASKTGTISATFRLSNFEAGSPVDYTVFYNGVAQGTGTFLWSDDNANYIGIDSRDGTSVGFDNFSIGTIPEPSTLLLALLGVFTVAGRGPLQFQG